MCRRDRQVLGEKRHKYSRFHSSKVGQTIARDNRDATSPPVVHPSCPSICLSFGGYDRCQVVYMYVVLDYS